MIDGANAAETPAGSPVTVSVSGLLNPPVTDVCTAIESDADRTSDIDDAPVVTLNPLTATVIVT